MSPRTACLTATRTGIRIGIAFQRPAAPIEGDALKLQGALLAKPKEDRSYRFATWAMYFAAVLAIIVVIGVAK